MAIVSGIATLIALLAFIGIVWWAFSKGRAEANQAASLLPFAVPDELQNDPYTGESHE